ncbi:MAG TPA: M12 family metallopeptidase [Longimicrobiaceae bacterium]
MLALLVAGCQVGDGNAPPDTPPDAAPDAAPGVPPDSTSGSVAAADEDEDGDTTRMVFNDYLCTTQVPSAKEWGTAAATARIKLPFWQARQRGAALRTARRWSIGKRLRVRFMNGDSLLKERVFNTALEWTKYANVRFVRSEDADAEIRIAFTTDGASWSFVGTEAEEKPLGRHTMQFGWLTPYSAPSTLRAVVLHEFGHALGLVHEHQQPKSSIPWDRTKVYKHYGALRPPWSRKEVDEQVFKRYEAGETQYSEWDSGSIMQYPVPNSLTVGDFQVGWNTRLSHTDIRYIGCWYHLGNKPGKECSTSS